MPKLVAGIVLAAALAVANAAGTSAAGTDAAGTSEAGASGTAASAAGASAASPAQVLRANRRAAVSAADRLLGALVLPAGAKELPTEPAGDAHQLEFSAELLSFAAEVDRHEFWTTTASPSVVLATIEAHLPPRATSTGSGYSGTSRFVAYSLPALDAPVLGPRSFAVDAVELAGGGTGVRVDASVRYSAPRLLAQRIPAQARVLEITMTRSRFEPSPSPTLKSPLVITERSDVRRIAAIVDSLPFAAANRLPIACPVIRPAPIDTFTFRSSRAGRVLATVSEAADTPTGADLCITTALTIRGHRQPGLLEGGRLLRQAGAILGVRLTTRF